MIDTLIFNHKWQYETNRLIRSFFLPCKFQMLYNSPPQNDKYILTDSDKAEIRDGDLLITEYELIPDGVSDEQAQRTVCHCLYRALSRYTGIDLDWGLLTGVRPVKYIETKKQEGLTDNYFKEKFLVTDKKLALANRVISAQHGIRKKLKSDGFSLYISIPFCPGRCGYCSFVSHSAGDMMKLIPQYMDCLITELEQIRQIVKEFDLKLQCVYIGGGTPTILECRELERILNAVSLFDSDCLVEYTVEGGRPETFTTEKLALMRNFGIGRICINPQTLSDAVLRNIGRSHTEADFYRTYALAQKAGFENINTDLIAGLPSDSYSGFTETLEKIIRLRPASITIHSLSLKRASDIYREDMSQIRDVDKMTEAACNLLTQSEYQPIIFTDRKTPCKTKKTSVMQGRGTVAFIMSLLWKKQVTL